MKHRIKAGIALIIVLLLCTSTAVMIEAHIAAPVYRGPAAGNFDGYRFHNTLDSDLKSLDMIKLAFEMPFKRQTWPESIEQANGKQPPARAFDSLSVSYIGHASVLIQIDGINILTDPMYSTRASSLSWLGPKRVRSPAIAMADLPVIDVILISHNHYDHLDLATLQQLSRRTVQKKPPLILAGLGNGALFKENAISNYRDLAWQESVNVGKLKFIFAESRHGSGRGIRDQMRTLWGAFIIKTSLGNIYFAGDTAYGPHFVDAARQHGEFILSLLPIGAFEPRWFMQRVHVNPAEAVQAHLDLKSQRSLAIHHGTFQIRAFEAISQAYEELHAAMRSANIPADDFLLLDFGESRKLSPLSSGEKPGSSRGAGACESQNTREFCAI